MKQDTTTIKKFQTGIADAILTNPKVTIYTISEELGVSPTTVSRALSRHPSVSAAVRSRILTFAEKHRFKPRYVSAHLTNLCVLIQQYDGHPQDFSQFLSLVLEGVAKYCLDENVEMSLYSAQVHELNACDLVRALRRRHADGAIVVRANEQTHYLQQLSDQRFPYLCLLNGDEDATHPVLSIDDERLASEAVEHLIAYGHRRIGMLINAPHGKRWTGYRNALARHGLPFDDQLVLTPNLTLHKGDFDFGAQAVDTLLERASDMTAIFASSEECARGALHRLYERQIAVPRQFSVVGFDDFPGTAYTCPSLTTVHVPYFEIGYEGARQVHRRCRGLAPLLSEETADKLAGRLIVRKSTASVPGQDHERSIVATDQGGAFMP